MTDSCAVWRCSMVARQLRLLRVPTFVRDNTCSVKLQSINVKVHAKLLQPTCTAPDFIPMYEPNVCDAFLTECLFCNTVLFLTESTRTKLCLFAPNWSWGHETSTKTIQHTIKVAFDCMQTDFPGSIGATFAVSQVACPYQCFS